MRLKRKLRNLAAMAVLLPLVPGAVLGEALVWVFNRGPFPRLMTRLYNQISGE